MHKRPSCKDIIQLIVLSVLVLLVVVPSIVLKKDHPFRTSSIQYWYGGIWLTLTILTVRSIMNDHPFLLHPWDEPSDEEDGENDDDDDDDDAEEENDSTDVSNDD